MDSYQGLVGRPGIDFPVLTHIPNTVFDCKNHGNGYFADLETRCQVFHICDDGKKISFLCPNGTIFRQLDLICDWWFKVDCASTPNHFAESTEMLTQAKRAQLLDDDEQLQRAQSEFILANQNNGPIYERNKYSVISLHNLKENSVSVETFNASNKTSNKTNITDQHNVSQQQTQ
ncbi:AGAP010302-PA, partial [Anopheles gambiae str. PEST]